MTWKRLVRRPWRAPTRPEPAAPTPDVPCVNFRDVGRTVNELAGRPLLPEGRFLRGGRLDRVVAPEEIGAPGTILNLRLGDDPPARRFGADYRQVPVASGVDRYDAGCREVRRWLNAVLVCIADDVTRFPLFVHCTSGKDRTGMVVATTLLALGIPRAVILAEYRRSAGALEPAALERALDVIEGRAGYLRRVDRDALRAKLGGPLAVAPPLRRTASRP